MSDTIRNVAHNFEAGDYWHLTAPGSHLHHNARVLSGLVPSISGIPGAVSRYSFANRTNPKEILWDSTRLKSFATKPSRFNSFFCFNSEASAEKASVKWFGGEKRERLKCKILLGANFGHFDSVLLDGAEDKWLANAERYWSGETTGDPLIETIVHGSIYFPDWQEFPLGFG